MLNIRIYGWLCSVFQMAWLACRDMPQNPNRSNYEEFSLAIVKSGVKNIKCIDSGLKDTRGYLLREKLCGVKFKIIKRLKKLR